MTPTVLNNRYRVVRVLASGGFGDTFLAEDSFLPSNRLCVIKQLKLLIENPQVYKIVQERFRREAAILEELGQASGQIPELYAYFEEAGRFYLVQEWVEGQTLGHKVRTEGIFSEFAVKQLLEKTLPVLSYLHGRGIIHRDIKPDNIILRRKDGLPILIDFGAVKQSVGTMLNSQGQTTSSIVIGTPGYMPPEQGVGRPVFSSDLYSLGLTAIYLLTGKLPQEFSTNHRTGELIWRSAAPTVSDRFADILDRVIQYHPRDRFATADKMLSVLQAPTVLHSVSRGTVFPDSIDPTVAPDLSASLQSPPRPVSVSSAAAYAPPPLSLASSIASIPPTFIASTPPPPSLPASVSSAALAPGAPPPTQVHPTTAKASSRLLVAAGIMATLLSFAGGGTYFYYAQQRQPQQEAQDRLEQIRSAHLKGDHQACVSQAELFSRQFPSWRDRVQPLLTDCASARDKDTLQQAVNIASADDPDWDEAIAKAKAIPTHSPIYKKAAPFLFKWQANALQDYLRLEVPDSQLTVSATLPSYELTVEQVTPEQVVISYDASANTRRQESDSIKLTTALLMELLQGNGADIAPRYTNFTQLVVYPRQSDRQAVLRSDDWQTYLTGKVSGTPMVRLQEQLKEKIELTNRE